MEFVRHRIYESVGTHQAQAIELDGRVGTVGKPFPTLRSELEREPDVDGVHLWIEEDER